MIPSSEIERAARFVYETFVRDEAQGYRSRDRQFAISILGQALGEPPSVDLLMFAPPEATPMRTPRGSEDALGFIKGDGETVGTAAGDLIGIIDALIGSIRDKESS